MKSKRNKRASTASKSLEQAWTMLREIEPQIPAAVVIILGAGMRRKRDGHFVPSTWRNRHGRWTHEVAISPDLFCNHSELLATMLHEAAHSILRNDQGGCTSDTLGYMYYHRKEFRDTCEKLGLQCSFSNTRHGWNLTGWPVQTGVDSRYNSIIKYLTQHLPLGTCVPKEPKSLKNRGKKTPQFGLTRITCNCKNSRGIYVNKSILKQGGIICNLCDTPFKIRKTPEE